MEDQLAQYLARQARSLRLDLQTLADADPEQVRAFARAALRELAALGLLPGEEPGEEEVGCWAAARSGLH